MTPLDETEREQAEQAAARALKLEQERAGRPVGPDPKRLTELLAYELLARRPRDVWDAPHARAEGELRNHWPAKWRRDERQTFFRLAMIALRDRGRDKAKRAD